MGKVYNIGNAYRNIPLMNSCKGGENKWKIKKDSK